MKLARGWGAVAVGDRYCFESCELKVANRTLLVDGVPVDLQPRAFDLLLYLVEHAGRVVTKDELLDNVWGQRFVTESVIARMVMKVRKAIGDDAGDPRFILTQYGAGYRFVGEVERIVDPLPGERSATNPGGDTLPGVTVGTGAAAVGMSTSASTGTKFSGQLPGWRRYALPVAAVVAVIALVLAVVLLPRPSQSEGPPRVAILPVVNATGDASLEWVELGLMSAIADSVTARMPVNLISTAELLSMLKAVPGDELTLERLETVRSRLNADVLVLGRLRRVDKVFGLEVALFRDGRKSSLAVLNDKAPAALVEPAGQTIVEALAPDAFRPGAKLRNQISPDPYINEVYARALDAQTRRRFDEAAELFRVVVRKTGDQLGPQTRLANALNRIGKHEQALELALKIIPAAQQPGDEDELARAHNIAAYACFSQGDFDCAVRHGNKMLELASPELPSIEVGAYNILGIVAAERGQLAEARRLMEATIVAYQRMKSSFRLASAHFNLATLLDQQETSDSNGARYNLERALEFARSSGRTNLQVDALDRLANIQRKEGDCAKAFELIDAADAIQRANKLSIASRINLEVRALCLHALGRSHEALEVVDEMEKIDLVTQRPSLVAIHKVQRANILRSIPAHSQAQVQSLYQQAEAGFKEIGMQIQLKEVLAAQARYATAHGRNEDAAAFLAQAQQLVDGGEAGNDTAILDARAMAAYYAGDPQRALDLLEKAATSSHPGAWWKERTALMAWLQLDLGDAAAAAELFGRVATYEKGYASVCLVGARLRYENDKYQEAVSMQTACIKQLGDRATPTAYAFLDAYTAATTTLEPPALPSIGPQALWL